MVKENASREPSTTRINKAIQTGYFTKSKIDGNGVVGLKKVKKDLTKKFFEKKISKKQRAEFEPKVDVLYSLHLLEHLVNTDILKMLNNRMEAHNIKKGKENFKYDSINDFIRGNPDEVATLKIHLQEALENHGVNRRLAKQVAAIPRNRIKLRGYLAELIAQTILHVKHGKDSVYGTAGDWYNQPKVFPKSNGNYLKPDFSIHMNGSKSTLMNRWGIETSNPEVAFVEVKAYPLKKSDLEHITKKYLGKSIKTTKSDNIPSSKGLIFAMADNPKKMTNGVRRKREELYKEFAKNNILVIHQGIIKQEYADNKREVDEYLTDKKINGILKNIGIDHKITSAGFNEMIQFIENSFKRTTSRKKQKVPMSTQSLTKYIKFLRERVVQGKPLPKLPEFIDKEDPDPNEWQVKTWLETLGLA